MSGGLSILIPVFNERGTVEAAINDALTAELPVSSRQLVVVDDGSTDGTREFLASSTFPDAVTVVYHDRNLGKGAAVRTALGHANEEFAAILDADLEYHASDLGHVLEPLALRRGARRVRHPRVDVPVVVQLLVRRGQQGRHVRDQRPLQLLDLGRHDLPQGDANRALPLAPLRERGFAIEPEIAARLLLAGERIHEVPISYRARGRDAGKKLTAVDGLRVLRTLLRCRVS